MIPYWIMYIYLLIKDSMKLYFFPKIMDIPINILTFILLIWFVIDIILRCFTDKGYFFWFFFFADLACLFFIVSSAVVTSISIWITLSFLKILMVLKITSLIQAYKEWRRKLKFWAKLRKEWMSWNTSNQAILGKGGLLAAPAKAKKSIFNSLKRSMSKKSFTSEPKTPTIGSARQSRFSTVNLKVLNTNETLKEEEDRTFSK